VNTTLGLGHVLMMCQVTGHIPTLPGTQPAASHADNSRNALPVSKLLWQTQQQP
jgi:hypothetical protein